MYYAQNNTGKWIDLWRFETEKQRDDWVNDRPSTAVSILSKDARPAHKEQFRQWKNQDK